MPCSWFISVSITKKSLNYLPNRKKINQDNTEGYRTQKYVFQDAKNETVQLYTFIFSLYFFYEIV